MTTRSGGAAGSEDGHRVPLSEHSIPARTRHRSKSPNASARLPCIRLVTCLRALLLTQARKVEVVPGTDSTDTTLHAGQCHNAPRSVSSRPDRYQVPPSHHCSGGTQGPVKLPAPGTGTEFCYPSVRFRKGPGIEATLRAQARTPLAHIFRPSTMGRGEKGNSCSVVLAVCRLHTCGNDLSRVGGVRCATPNSISMGWTPGFARGVPD